MNATPTTGTSRSMKRFVPAATTSHSLKRFFNECHVSPEEQDILTGKYNISDYASLQLHRDALRNCHYHDIDKSTQENLGRILDYLVEQQQHTNQDGNTADPLNEFQLKKYYTYYLRLTKDLRMSNRGAQDNDEDMDDGSTASSTGSMISSDDDDLHMPQLVKTIVITKKPTKPVAEDDDDNEEDEEELFDDGTGSGNTASSGLFMGTQGIEPNLYNDGLQSNDKDESDKGKGTYGGIFGDEARGIMSVEYNKKTYHVGKCYYYRCNNTKVVVGIKSFTPDKQEAKTVEIQPIMNTFLGVHDQDQNESRNMFARAIRQNKIPFSHVQVPMDHTLKLMFFDEPVKDDDANKYPVDIPKLIYEKQKDGNKRNFAYYLDRRQYHSIDVDNQNLGIDAADAIRTMDIEDHEKGEREDEVVDDTPRDEQSTRPERAANRMSTEIHRAHPRDEMRVLDLFSGAGLMHQGYKREGYKTAAAVELNEFAVKTFVHNNKSDKGVVYNGDVGDFFNDYKNNVDELQEKVGRVDIVHASSPCQGFSGANIYGGKNDKTNNDLSLTFVEALRIFQPPVGIFENVSGMWKTEHLSYLRTILIECLKMQYQVRCSLLWACHYGDSQKRPRLIVFAVKNYAPMPSLPIKTHGPPGCSDGTIPFVPVSAVLDPLLACTDDEYPNMQDCRKTSLQAGEQKVEQLDPNGLAPAVRAKGTPLLHYGAGNRCVNIREAAALMSLPYDYEFLGGMMDRYKQVGNGVPVELAAAIARSVKPVLKWVYKEENGIAEERMMELAKMKQEANAATSGPDEV